MHLNQWHTNKIIVNKKDKILFLTKDLNIIKKQLYDNLILKFSDINKEDLLNDINTDTITPGWVCLNYKPEDIAVNAYAGLLDENGQRIFTPNALKDGNFKIIVSGTLKGTGSSRETAAQCEYFSGVHIIIAGSFAPIYEKNCINLGQLCGGYEILEKIENNGIVTLKDFTYNYNHLMALITTNGGIFNFFRNIHYTRSSRILHLVYSMTFYS